MLLARFCDVNGSPIVQRGTCRIERYTGQGKGWFPIESFNFGFEDKTKAGKTPAGAPAKPDPKAKTPPQQGGHEEPQDFATVTLKKVVDATSCSLMMLVMEERKSGQGGAKEEKNIEVDIHVISTVNF